MPTPRTLVCPDCHAEATVVESFVAAPGGVEYLRIRCTGVLTLLVRAPDPPSGGD